MVLPRTTPTLRTLIASQVRAGSRAAWQSQRQLAVRRFYASQGGHGAQKKSDLPWLIGSIALTTPAAIYLWTSGPPETEHGLGPQRPLLQKDSKPQEHGENKEVNEEKEEKEEEAPSEESESEGEQKDTPQSSDDEGHKEKPSELDPPKAFKPTEGPKEKSGAQSAKQQGLSNADTKHPDLEAPGKSVKAEGEIDTAKVKGTVSPER